MGVWEGVSDEERDNRTGVPRAAAKKVFHWSLPSVKPGRLRGISFRCPSPEADCRKPLVIAEGNGNGHLRRGRLRAWRTWSVGRGSSVLTRKGFICPLCGEHAQRIGLGGNQELRVSVLRKTVVPGDVGRYKGGRIPTGSLLARKATRGRGTWGNGKAS